MRNLVAMLVAGSLATWSTAAVAGTAIKGIGSTRSAAMDDANARAKAESVKRFGRDTCITFAKLDSCVIDQGDWICIAYVANHEGSCSTRR